MPSAAVVNGIYILWKLIFVLSNGAIVVLATAPATAPAASDVNIFVLLDTCNDNQYTQFT